MTSQEVIYPLGGAYSSISILPDGRIAIYYEKSVKSGYDMAVTTFTLDWATDVLAVWTPPKKSP